MQLHETAQKDALRILIHNIWQYLEVLAAEIDTSITGRRLIRVFERLQALRGLPQVLRLDNGPSS